MRIVQITQNRWQIETPKGFVLKDDIYLSNAIEADVYARGYSSSFLNWTYEVVPMEIKKRITK